MFRLDEWLVAGWYGRVLVWCSDRMIGRRNRSYGRSSGSWLGRLHE